MNVDTMTAANLVMPRANEPAQQVNRKRQDSQQQSAPTSQDNKMPPEELLSQINSITENGLYSVRFERDKDTSELIVKVVNSSTNEVIRQIPSESMVHLSKSLSELRGNLVDTVS
ncbi:MAG: flagellar protein FlaG [Proteobacteria bacterium]|nr:flagellar protein FlaG [Pseudomonadota bacterium]